MEAMLNYEESQTRILQDCQAVCTCGSVCSIAAVSCLLVRSAAILLLFASLSVNVSADDWYHDRAHIYPIGDWHANVFDDIGYDLEHLQDAFPAGKDHKRIEMTIYKLDDLQYRLDHGGKYDSRELKFVMRTISAVAEDNRLASSDRTVLNDDLNKLRDYEAHHDHWSHN